MFYVKLFRWEGGLARFPPGTEVFSGHFNDQQTDPIQYKLIEKQTDILIVPADSLQYVIAEHNFTAMLDTITPYFIDLQY